MDTLVMHRTLTEAGFASGQAEAIVKVLQGGVVTKEDLALTKTALETRFAGVEARIDRLDNKLDLILVVAVLSVLGPALPRLIVGS